MLMRVLYSRYRDALENVHMHLHHRLLGKDSVRPPAPDQRVQNFSASPLRDEGAAEAPRPEATYPGGSEEAVRHPEQSGL